MIAVRAVVIWVKEFVFPIPLVRRPGLPVPWITPIFVAPISVPEESALKVVPVMGSGALVIMNAVAEFVITTDVVMKDHQQGY